jgi:hypothetical protein
MTVVFDDFRINSGAESYQISCHCEERKARRGNPRPRIRRMLSPIGATFGIHISTININLPMEDTRVFSTGKQKKRALS